MTSHHLSEVLSMYHNKWSKHYSPQRQDTAELMPGMKDKEKVLSHAMWMCEQSLEFVKTGDVEKAMRWLGFIQAVFYFTGHYTIDEMRAHSASPTDP